MTVTASPNDTTDIYGQGVGKGTQVLAAVATAQTLAATAKEPFLTSVRAQLNLLQIAAVDYFMGSYWVSADQILATFEPLTVPAKYAGYVNAQLAAIAARLVQIDQTNPTQYSQALVYGNEAPQYSAYMPPYPITPPDTRWYQLQTELVDFLMTHGIVLASQILSQMTGTQTYPFTYNSNGQFFSPYGEGSVDLI